MEPVIAGADFYRAAQSALANRRTRGANVELVRDTIKQPQRGRREAIESQQFSGTFFQGLYGLRKSMSEIEIQAASYDSLWCGHVDQTIVVSLNLMRGLVPVLAGCRLMRRKR